MKKILFLLILLFPTGAWAASVPVIFYSDLTSGPNTGGQNNKGVFVTIWGNNFGASQGTSTVTINGGLVDNYPTWTNTQICFQLGSGVSTGNITVTTPVGVSNGIPFTVRSGNIYFVNPAASVNGSGTFASPFNHMHGAYLLHAAGDTIYIRAGTITNEYNCRSGWHSICAEDFSATQANPVAWVAYPNEIVTLTSTDSTSTYPDGADTIQYGFRTSGPGSAWITISKIYFSMGGGLSFAAAQADTGWRVVGNNITTHNMNYGTIDFSGSNVEILGNEIHDCFEDTANNLTHSIYIDGPNNNYEVAWNNLHNNSGQGFEISSYHNGPRIGSIHDNKITAANAGDVKGVLAGGGGDGGSGNPDTNSTMYTNSVNVYNNILVNLGIASSGGAMQANVGKFFIYNNTIYGSGNENKGMIQFCANACFGSGGGAPAFNFADNIMYANQTGKYLSDSNGNDPPWADFLTLADNIYFNGGSAPTQDSTAINSDPKWVTNFTDFHLQSTSPAIGAGFNTNSVVASDYDGLTRGNPPDIGAYQFAAGGSCSANGASCSVNTSCCSFLCSVGSCVSCIANGNACTTNASCCTGVCSSSVCGTPAPATPRIVGDIYQGSLTIKGVTLK